MPAYNEADEGSGDSGVIATTGPSRDVVKKLDQIIQVRATIHYSPRNWHTDDFGGLELPYQGCLSCLTISNAITRGVHQRWDEEA